MLEKGKYTIWYYGSARVIVALNDDIELVTEGPNNTEYYRFARSTTIRNWGSKHSLGQIAYHGPTKETVLDAVPCVAYAPLRAVHDITECSDHSFDAWKKGIEEAEVRLLKES